MSLSRQNRSSDAVAIESHDDLRLSKDCFLPYWRDTSFLLTRRCLHVEFSDETFNLEDEIIRLKSCQEKESADLWEPPNRFFYFIPINILSIPNKRIVSFSLFGIDDRYYRNTIRIIRRYKELLPGWIPRFWISSDVPFLVINRLLHEDVEVIIVYQRQPEIGNITRIPGFHGMFWRFFVADDEHVERYIVRDSDSMLIQREVDAVKEWIKDETMFHVMRDHKLHDIEILGGMWGGKVDKAIFSPSEEYGKALATGFIHLDGRQVDQSFLKKYLWPIARHQMTCHSSFEWPFVDGKGCKRFPTQRIGNSFVGAVIEY